MRKMILLCMLVAAPMMAQQEARRIFGSQTEPTPCVTRDVYVNMVTASLWMCKDGVWDTVIGAKRPFFALGGDLAGWKVEVADVRTLSAPVTGATMVLTFDLQQTSVLDEAPLQLGFFLPGGWHATATVTGTGACDEGGGAIACPIGITSGDNFVSVSKPASALWTVTTNTTKVAGTLTIAVAR